MDVHILRPGGRTPIRARSLNLSPTGVFLEAEHRAHSDCPVGTQLLCDIPLPGGRRYLKGRVARTQSMPSSATGLGISFENLEAADQAILHSLVQNNSDHSRLVKVRFEGMPEALRSRAVVTKDGLRLQTSLPFLRIDSAVDVSFIAGDSRVETHGTLERVHLEPQETDGIPRLAVDVTLPDSSTAFTNEFLNDNSPTTGEFGAEATTKRGVALEEANNEPIFLPSAGPFNPSPSAPTLVLHTNDQHPELTIRDEAEQAEQAEDEVELSTTLQAHTPSRNARRKQPTRIRERRPLPAAQMPAPVRLGEVDEAVPATLAAPIIDLVAAPSRDHSANPWWWTWGWPVLGTILLCALVYDRLVVAERLDVQISSQTEAIKSARTDLAETRSLARQAKGAAEATQAATLGLRGVIHKEIKNALEQSGRGTSKTQEDVTATKRSASPAQSEETPVAPKLQISGDTATVSVAIRGSAASMIHYSLVQPSGVVVKLPLAQARLPLGHYQLSEGGFSAVWVDQKPDGLTIRFVYDHSRPLQEMLEVIDAGPDQTAAAGSPESLGSVRVRLRRR
jgi:hypothetical protein